MNEPPHSTPGSRWLWDRVQGAELILKNMFLDNKALSFIQHFIGTYSVQRTLQGTKVQSAETFAMKVTVTLLENEDLQCLTQKLSHHKGRNTNGKKKKRAKGWVFLTLKLWLLECERFTVPDKMACLQLPGQQKPFSFLQDDGCVICFPAAISTAPPQHPSLLLLTCPRGLGQDTSVLCTVWLPHPCLFPSLRHSLPPVFHATSACLCWATFFSSSNP